MIRNPAESTLFFAVTYAIDSETVKNLKEFELNSTTTTIDSLANAIISTKCVAQINAERIRTSSPIKSPQVFTQLHLHKTIRESGSRLGDCLSSDMAYVGSTIKISYTKIQPAFYKNTEVKVKTKIITQDKIVKVTASFKLSSSKFISSFEDNFAKYFIYEKSMIIEWHTISNDNNNDNNNKDSKPTSTSRQTVPFEFSVTEAPMTCADASGTCFVFDHVVVIIDAQRFIDAQLSNKNSNETALEVASKVGTDIINTIDFKHSIVAMAFQNSSFYGVTKTGTLIKYQLQGNMIFNLTLPKDLQVLSLCVGDQAIYLGTDTGVRVVQLSNPQKPGVMAPFMTNLNPDFSRSVHSMEKVEGGILAGTTNSDGVFFLSDKKAIQLYKHITTIKIVPIIKMVINSNGDVAIAYQNRALELLARSK